MGVIDEEGQWEHCNHCGDFELIQYLTELPSPKWPMYPTVDLCRKCKIKSDKGLLRLEDPVLQVNGSFVYNEESQTAMRKMYEEDLIRYPRSQMVHSIKFV